MNRTLFSSSTEQPLFSSTTSSVQNLIKRKNANTVSSTSHRPPLGGDDDSSSRSTTRAQLVYATSATPRNRFIFKSNEDASPQKSEGQQLPRPEELVRPTEVPLFRRLALKHSTVEPKPVTEESEPKSNILRRQLPRETDYDPHQQLYTLQQSLGSDTSDVYSASMTTGTTRPLFTTTNRPIRLSSTTALPIRRATIRYPKNLQTSSHQKEEPAPTTEQQESNSEPVVSETTPTSIPVVQIPPNRAQPETLVAIRHPYQRDTVLVPLSHLQRRLVPFASPRI
ncbi:hypothetical protein HHI36_012977 [Cryptolaemus montrouzieri]|uniref:Uncharacterized protein n=1 Tax=Cryptolaemus montrouzieri TaxID=559131 RepID=A0ABD2NG08_9CUCU